MRRTLVLERFAPCLFLALCVVLFAGSARSQTPSLAEVTSAVVRVKTVINHDGRTVEGLGREREGSGIVIDSAGLVLTIGYLMVEAHAAEVIAQDGRAVPANVVGYDHETGFGLLRTIAPLNVKPLALGRSSDVKPGDILLLASAGGPEMAAAAMVVARREFTGSWEYLLDDAIFTSPPHPAWSGAALVTREGKLVGVGSLIVSDATGARDNMPGNMSVPIDLLRPILADLMADGRRSGPPRPWLGITATEAGGRVIVIRVAPGGPADKAGLSHGHTVLGIGGAKVGTLAEFYRGVWARGAAGVTIPLDVLQDEEERRVEVQSVDRLDHLRLKSTY